MEKIYQENSFGGRAHLAAFGLRIDKFKVVIQNNFPLGQILQTT